MSAEKFVELQHQMRQNQTELSEYLSDLQGWEEEMKEKDRKLNEGESSDAAKEQNLPPVRNSLEKQKRRKKKKKTEQKEENGSKPKRISSYDYRSWDKFDVDKACEDVEFNKSSENDSEYETDEEWEVLRQKQKAADFKDQGNEYFKEGKYDQAVECYTRGIDCDETNAVLSANRAMALLKQTKYGAAELDCTASISLDPAYVKAYHRRGTARIGLKKFKEAQSDFQKVLSLEPNNNLAKRELRKIEKILNPPPFSQTTDGDLGTVKAINKPSEKRSKKPLRRLQIEEIGDDEDTPGNNRLNDAAAEAAFDSKFLCPSTSSSSSSKTPESTYQAESDPCVKPAHDNNSRYNSEKSNYSARETATGDGSLKRSPRVPPIPTTSYRFQADWKELKHTTDEFFHYFKEIDPAAYPELFGEALAADVLIKILTTLKDFYIPSDLDPTVVLSALPQVKRFSMTLLFMSCKEKQVVKDLFDCLSATEANLVSADLALLRRKYDV